MEKKSGSFFQKAAKKAANFVAGEAVERAQCSMTVHSVESPACLTEGMEVTIDGLKSKPELNGTKATALTYDSTTDRWEIKLPSGSSLAVKPTNLSGGIFCSSKQASAWIISEEGVGKCHAYPFKSVDTASLIARSFRCDWILFDSAAKEVGVGEGLLGTGRGIPTCRAQGRSFVNRKAYENQSKERYSGKRVSTSSGAGIVLSTNDEVFNVKMDSGEIVSENVDNVKLIGQAGADDDNESMFSLHAVFNPLDGVMNEPKLPFEETIQRSGVAGLELQVRESMLFGESHAAIHAHLDQDEVASLNFYSQQTLFFSTLNRLLRSRDLPEIKKRFFPYIRLVLGGAFKCPLKLGTFTRGVDIDMLPHVDTTAPFYWWSFTSTTEQVCQVDPFLGSDKYAPHQKESTNSTLFMINGAGVDLVPFSAYKYEKETLFLPGSLFEIDGKPVQRGSLKIIQLSQIPAPRVFDFIHPQSEILDKTKRHTINKGEWERAWFTKDGAWVTAKCAAPVAFVAAVAAPVVMASSSIAGASAFFAGSAAAETAAAAAAAQTAAAATATASTWSLSGLLASATGTAATATATAGTAAAAAAEATALAAFAAEVAVASSTLSTVALSTTAGTAALSAGSAKTIMPFWWSCCGNRGQHTFNCCGCGISYHRTNTKCKPPTELIDVDANNPDDREYLTGERLVSAGTVGKFNFIHKVWSIFTELGETEQKSYRVYKANSDEHGDEAWQPLIEQKNNCLYYDGQYLIKMQQLTR
jgi:hypothetical protein